MAKNLSAHELILITIIGIVFQSGCGNTETTTTQSVAQCPFSFDEFVDKIENHQVKSVTFFPVEDTLTAEFVEENDICTMHYSRDFPLGQLLLDNNVYYLVKHP